MKKISTGADNGGTDMSQDPFQEREAEKYANPIPSREFIIEHLTKREKPANREELAVELNIEGEEQIPTTIEVEKSWGSFFSNKTHRSVKNEIINFKKYKK